MAVLAARLYHRGVAPTIVVTGFAHPSFGIHEATLMHQVLRQKGVPDSAIIVEESARNTGENMVLSAARLLERGIVPESIVLVSKSFAAARGRVTAHAQWPEPQPIVYSMATKPPFFWNFFRNWLHGRRHYFLSSILGEYERLFYRDYVEQGFIVPREFIQGIDDAYQRLKKRGFTGR
ncbi:YdcF family protein [Candidatus Saccharibacteria bacterium]|nr:YdcF family protein [Candidatus Saccharibacteria bacterium]